MRVNKFPSAVPQADDVVGRNNHVDANNVWSVGNKLSVEQNLADVLHKVENGEFWCDYDVVKSLADGHCLMHSVIHTYNMLHSSGQLSLPVLIRNLQRNYIEPTIISSRYNYFIGGHVKLRNGTIFNPEDIRHRLR